MCEKDSRGVADMKDGLASKKLSCGSGVTGVASLKVTHSQIDQRP